MPLPLHASLRLARFALPGVMLVLAALPVDLGARPVQLVLAAAAYFAVLSLPDRWHQVLLPTPLLLVNGWVIYITGGTESPFVVFLVMHLLTSGFQPNSWRTAIEIVFALLVAGLPLLYDDSPHPSYAQMTLVGGLLFSVAGWFMHRMWVRMNDLHERDREHARMQSEHEQRFRSLFDNHPDPVVAVSPDGLLTRVNAASERVLGLPASQIEDKPFAAFLHPDDLNPAMEAFQRVLAGAQERFLLRICAADGRVVVVETSGSPIVVDGETVGVFAICIDVTEKLAAQSELAAQRVDAVRMLEHQQLALAAGRMAVWEYHVASDELRWHLAPQTPQRISAFAAARTKRQWEDMVHPDDLATFVGFRDQALSTGGDLVVEHRVVLPGGEIAWVSTAARMAAAGTDGGPLLLYGVTADTTERRAAEDELRMGEERLRQAQQLEALGQLAGGIAHDFNNMLTAILGFSELLEIQLGEDPNVAHIRQAGERARDLVRQLLAFSRRPERAGVVDVSSGIDGVVALLGRLIGDHITLHTEIADDLGAVRLDGAQLEQIVLNLAVNARDAMPGGGELRLAASLVDIPEVEAAGHGLEAGRYVRLLVGDTGSGMRPEVVPHVFEPFYTTKPEGQGTGMGLATVYGIVTGAAGRIAIDTAPGEGTTVVVELPLAAESAEPSDARPLAELDQSASGTILLVEDQGQIRGLVRQALARRGYRVLTAADGQAALGVAREHNGRIDLLLTDVVMPNLNGVDLADRLRQENPDLRVLFMSGYARGEAFGNGVPTPKGTAFIQKPFGLGALLADVEGLLQGQSQAA